MSSVEARWEKERWTITVKWESQEQLFLFCDPASNKMLVKKNRKARECSLGQAATGWQQMESKMSTWLEEVVLGSYCNKKALSLKITKVVNVARYGQILSWPDNVNKGQAEKKNLEGDCELKFGYFQWCNKGVDFYQWGANGHLGKHF